MTTLRAAPYIGVSMRSTPEYEESGLFFSVSAAVFLAAVAVYVILLASGRTRRWFRLVRDARHGGAQRRRWPS